MKKRELLAFYLLCSKKEVRVWNIGDAIDVLVDELLFTRKVAYSVFRRLKRLGLLEHVGEYKYRCIDFNMYFDELLKNYICVKKLKRNP